MNEVVERWPKILEIGHATLRCGGVMYKRLIDCALLVHRTPGTNFVISQMIRNYEQSPIDFYEGQMWKNRQSLFHSRYFPVYNDVTGNVITIEEAYRRSLRFQSGEVYYRDLNRISALIRSLSRGEIAQELSRFSDLYNFQDYRLYRRREYIGTVGAAVTLLCTSSVNTEILE